MSGYELQQFVMVSPEVWQDLHLRYAESLGPWWLGFVLLNLLALLKSQRPLAFIYVSLCWVFLGVYYFMSYVQQVHTFALAMGGVFIVQGLAVFYLKVLRRQSTDQLVERKESGLSRVPVKEFALCIYGCTAFLPVSYLLDNTRESFLLFGYGAEQTALGTIALLVCTLRGRLELTLAFIPLGWIVFYLLAL